MPEAVIFIGIQASGKSTLYHRRFESTHIYINMDSLHTRRKEKLLLQECIGAKHSFVVDNTNPTKAERSVYIAAARENGYSVLGYYFRSVIAESLARNGQRSGKQKIPDRGIISTAKRLEKPSYNEGFDGLFYVAIGDDGQFIIDKWRKSDEV